MTSQDFKNELLNIRGRVNLNSDISLNARLSQFKDELDQNGSRDFVHSTTKEAEVYGKWQFTSSQNVLAGVTHQNIDGDVLSYGSPYDEDVNSTGYFVQHQYQNNGLNTQVGVRVEDNENTEHIPWHKVQSVINFTIDEYLCQHWFSLQSTNTK